MVALAEIQLRKHLTVMQVVDEVLLLLVIGHRLRFMDFFGILISMLDLILWDSYSSFFTSVNKDFGGEQESNCFYIWNLLKDLRATSG